MLALALATLLSHAPTQQAARVESSIRLFHDSRALIERELGKGPALDFAIRLVRDEENLELPVPQAYAADWNEALDAQISLDIQAVVDLASAKPRAINRDHTGLYEAFVRSSADGSLLPVAVYVPRRTGPGAPLALMLHGNQQPESALLGQPYFRRLADRTGTILVAPWARGIFEYKGVAQSDVYDVLRAALAAFHPDEKRTYLVGYSMGGFSAFKIGTAYRKWSAVMDVSGAIQDDSVAKVGFAWRATPVYVVTGKRDDVIPAPYPEQTATVLAALGVPTSFYEEAGGQHTLRTLMPSLRAAWLDMHAGIVHSGSIPTLAQTGLPKFVPVSGDQMKP